MKPVNFDYVLADTVAEVCTVLHHEGAQARIIAGGQSLGAMLNMRLATPSLIVDINRINGLDMIDVKEGFVVTGATVRQATALVHPAILHYVPLLAKALPHVGHYQTRSRGTLAGSVVHADPSAEIPLVLAVLGGAVELVSRKRRRKIPARDFILSSLVTAKAEDEIVVALHWPTAAPQDRFAFAEKAMRAGDFALVAAACHLEKTNDGMPVCLTIGFAGCGEKFQFLTLPVPKIVGHNFAYDVAEQAAAAIKCQGDIHASAAYRLNLVKLMARALTQEVFAADTIGG